MRGGVWGLFFTFLQTAFVTKNVPKQLKAEILLKLLRERAPKIIACIQDEAADGYKKVLTIVLR